MDKATHFMDKISSNIVGGSNNFTTQNVWRLKFNVCAYLVGDPRGKIYQKLCNSIDMQCRHAIINEFNKILG